MSVVYEIFTMLLPALLDFTKRECGTWLNNWPLLACGNVQPSNDSENVVSLSFSLSLSLYSELLAGFFVDNFRTTIYLNNWICSLEPIRHCIRVAHRVWLIEDLLQPDAEHRFGFIPRHSRSCPDSISSIGIWTESVYPRHMMPWGWII